MSIGRFGRVEDEHGDDLGQRITGIVAKHPSGSGRPTSLMDALHDRIAQVVEVTRSELRVQSSVIDELAEQVRRLEATVSGLTERLDASAAAPSAAAPSAEVLQRMEARLDSHVAAVEEGFRCLMAWLDAPAQPVFDLAAEEATGQSVDA